MGLPEIAISFQQKASSAILKSSRGFVAVLLNDDTTEQFLHPYTRISNVAETDWKEESLNAIKLIFKGAPKRVLAVRLLKTDGAVDLAATLNEIRAVNMDYLVYPDYTAGDKDVIKDFIKTAHEKGKKVKAVLPNCEADDMHIINFATESVTVRWEDMDATVTYTAAQYCCRIAGILAGLPLTQSSTYYELEEVVDATQPEDADAAVDAGKLIIIFDGEKYKIARGVTSLTTVTNEKPESFKRIKIVEGMDVIKHDIYSTFEDNYVGKVVNSYDNKQLFVGAVNDYLVSMQGTILDANAENSIGVDFEQNREYLEYHGTDTTDMTETELKEANTGSYMYLTGTCKFLDAAEDLNLQLYM